MVEGRRSGARLSRAHAHANPTRGADVADVARRVSGVGCCRGVQDVAHLRQDLLAAQKSVGASSEAPVPQPLSQSEALARARQKRGY